MCKLLAGVLQWPNQLTCLVPSFHKARDSIPINVSVSVSIHFVKPSGSCLLLFWFFQFLVAYKLVAYCKKRYIYFRRSFDTKCTLFPPHDKHLSFIIEPYFTLGHNKIYSFEAETKTLCWFVQHRNVTFLTGTCAVEAKEIASASRLWEQSFLLRSFILQLLNKPFPSEKTCERPPLIFLTWYKLNCIDWSEFDGFTSQGVGRGV